MLEPVEAAVIVPPETTSTSVLPDAAAVAVTESWPFARINAVPARAVDTDDPGSKPWLAVALGTVFELPLIASKPSPAVA